MTGRGKREQKYPFLLYLSNSFDHWRETGERLRDRERERDNVCLKEREKERERERERERY